MKFHLIIIVLFFSISFGQRKCDTQFHIGENLRINPPSWDDMVFSPSGEFKIHFDTTGVDAPDLTDENDNGIPDYVELVGSTIDYVKLMICDIMEYIEVPSNNNPPYPIYIDNRSNGSYGVNWSSGNSSEAPYGWIEIDNDYSEGSGYHTTGINAMQVTVAHEYFHAVQRKYREPSGNDTYFYEFSSTWIEELIFPDHNDYIYWIDNFNNNPAIPFDQTDGYSVASFGHYLNTFVENLNADNLLSNQLMRIVWENFNSSDNPLDRLSQVLEDSTSTNFMNCWSDFVARNYLNGSESEFHYYSDQILMNPISAPNPTSFFSNYDEEIILFNDNLSLTSVRSSLSGILYLNHSSSLPLGKIVKIGQTDMIYNPEEIVEIPMEAYDVLKFIYYSNVEETIQLNFELQRTPSPPNNLFAEDNYGKIELIWNESQSVGDSLKYFIYRNNLILDSTYSNFYIDENVELLEEYYYHIQAKNENGYSDFSTGVSMILWHNNEPMNENHIVSIYPNGIAKNDDSIFLIVDSNQIYNSPQVWIYNIKGQLENNFKLNSLVKGRQRINILNAVPDHSPSGNYFMKFCFDDQNCSNHKITWLK